MNLVERWFSELTTKLRRGTHRSVAELTDAINQWTQHWNQNPKPFLAQNRRPNLRQPHQLSTTNPRIRTLDGTIWGDFAVIARLEATVVVLWGGEHFAPVRHRTIKDTIKNQRRLY